LWDSETGKLTTTFVHFKTGGWAVVTPRGFTYDGQVDTKDRLFKVLRVIERDSLETRPIDEKEFESFHRPSGVRSVLGR
jgi:hypothetical protein